MLWVARSLLVPVHQSLLQLTLSFVKFALFLWMQCQAYCAAR